LGGMEGMTPECVEEKIRRKKGKGKERSWRRSRVGGDFQGKVQKLRRGRWGLSRGIFLRRVKGGGGGHGAFDLARIRGRKSAKKKKSLGTNWA